MFKSEWHPKSPESALQADQPGLVTIFGDENAAEFTKSKKVAKRTADKRTCLIQIPLKINLNDCKLFGHSCPGGNKLPMPNAQKQVFLIVKSNPFPTKNQGICRSTNFCHASGNDHTRRHRNDAKYKS